jgi:hypothetical protein
MLLKNAHLLRFPHPSSLRRTSEYASLLRISGALHLGIFEQQEEINFATVLAKTGGIKRQKEKKHGAFLGFGRIDSLGIGHLYRSDHCGSVSPFSGKKPGETRDPVFFFSAHLGP